MVIILIACVPNETSLAIIYVSHGLQSVKVNLNLLGECQNFLIGYPPLYLTVDIK